jgi:hypothetical protein
MNANEQFVPKWAAVSLENKATAEAEISLHRDFFDAWEAMHAVPKDKLHRPKAEQAAQKLVDIAQCIRRLREPPIIGSYR